MRREARTRDGDEGQGRGVRGPRAGEDLRSWGRTRNEAENRQWGDMDREQRKAGLVTGPLTLRPGSSAGRETWSFRRRESEGVRGCGNTENYARQQGRRAVSHHPQRWGMGCGAGGGGGGGGVFFSRLLPAVPQGGILELSGAAGRAQQPVGPVALGGARSQDAPTSLPDIW